MAVIKDRDAVANCPVFCTKSLTAGKSGKLAAFTFMVAMIMWFLNRSLFANRTVQWLPVSLFARDPYARVFVLARDKEVYMYSAIVKLNTALETTEPPQSVTDNIEIIITTLAASQDDLFCCVLPGGSPRKNLLMTPASVYYTNSVRRHTSGTIYKAMQFVCRVPLSSLPSAPSYVTLTSSSCSSDMRDYLPLIHPTRVPGGLALCGKIAHSGGLHPEKVIEWFEVQRILGVDKILIYDLGNPQNLTRVFKYYQNLGILDLQPYELPGYPRNRSLKEEFKKNVQFKHDETMAVLECRQRMGGYDYIMSHDLDEFIIPRKNITLKELLKEHLKKEPYAAGFYFNTEFFITSWEPTNPEEDLMVKRYRKSTEPRWECYKYIYLPSRVITSTTHEFKIASSSFSSPRMSAKDAILHHYRQCPEDTWGTCSVNTIIDDVMTRYTDLEDRVAKVRQATSTRSQWAPAERAGR